MRRAIPTVLQLVVLPDSDVACLLAELGSEAGDYGTQELTGRVPGLFRLWPLGSVRGARIAKTPSVLREPLDSGQLSGDVFFERQAHLFQLIQVVRLFERNLVPSENCLQRFFGALLGVE